MPPDPLTVSLVATQLAARVPGGTGRYTARLREALASTRPGRAELRTVWARGTPGLGGLERPGDVHLPLDVPMLARLWERRLPPRVGGDVVHAPTLLVPPVVRRAALVVTVHDVVPWTHPETLTDRGVSFHRRMGERAASEAALIVTPTQAVARAVRELLDPRGEVEAVPPGPSDLQVPTDAAHRRERLGTGSDYILFVGTAEPRKGLADLVSALTLPALRGRRLVVVGPPGWGGVSVPELAERAGVSDRVVVTGRVDDADLAAAYDGAAVVAVPSLAEGFGLPVLEAMALGAAVVTSDDPALVEAGAGAAAVVPRSDPDALADALARLLDDEAARGAAVEAGAAVAAASSWARSAAALWQRYGALSTGG